MAAVCFLKLLNVLMYILRAQNVHFTFCSCFKSALVTGIVEKDVLV